MAKRRSRRGSRKNSKAQAIRDEFVSQGASARPKDVIAALKTKGVTVSSAQVSNIKARLRKGKRRRGGKAGAASREANGTVSLDLLLEAKKLAERIGGVDVAKRLLDALHRLS